MSRILYSQVRKAISFTTQTEKKSIDFLMGWCVGNFRWNELKIKKAITKSNAPNYVYPFVRPVGVKRWTLLSGWPWSIPNG